MEKLRYNLIILREAISQEIWRKDVDAKSEGTNQQQILNERQLNLIGFQETIWTSGASRDTPNVCAKDHTCVEIHYTLFNLTTEIE